MSPVSVASASFIARRADNSVRRSCGKAHGFETLYPTWYPIYNIKVGLVVHGTISYHACTTSIRFELRSGRVVAQPLLVQANIGTAAAAVMFLAAITVEHCEPLLCVC